MANRNMYPSQSGGYARVYLEFELLGNSTSAPTLSSDAAPWVASVTRSGVGVYVVTMKDAWTKCLYKAAEPDDTANDGSYCTVGNLTNEGTSTALQFTIRARAAAGTAADLAVGRRIGVCLALRNGSWGIP